MYKLYYYYIAVFYLKPDCYYHSPSLLLLFALHTAITCSTLNAPANGLVSYDPDLTAPYEFGTTATYICTTGFGLFGGSRTRECVVSSLGGGGWSGTTPTCGSELITEVSLTL